MVEKVIIILCIQAANGNAIIEESRHVRAFIGKYQSGSVDGRHQLKNLVQDALGGVIAPRVGDSIRGEGANVRFKGNAPLGILASVTLWEKIVNKS